MKIIAKQPDYYDHYSQVFGIDPLIRYERNSEFTDPPEKVFTHSRPGKCDLKIARFFICGTVYDILFDAVLEKLLYGDQISQLSKEQIKTEKQRGNVRYLSTVRHPKVAEVALWGDFKHKYYVLTEPMNIDEFRTVFEAYFENGTSNRYKDQNLILNCPVVMTTNDRCFKNPILANWGFGSIIPASELFSKISNWFLERTKDIPNNQTDMEKLTAHGFDRKTSFRH